MIFPPKLTQITILAKNIDKAQTIRQLHKLGVLHVTQTPQHKLLEEDNSLSGVDEISNALLTLNYIAQKTHTKSTKTLSKLPSPLLAVTEAKAFIKQYLEPLEELLSDEEEIVLALKQTETRKTTTQQLPFDIPTKPGYETLVYTSNKHVEIKARDASITHKKKNKKHYLRIIIPSQQAQKLQELVEETPLKKIDVSWTQHTRQETQQALQRKEQALQKELTATQQAKNTLLASDESELQYLITSLENHYDAYTLPNQFKKSKHFFVATGYCEKADIPDIQEALPNALITHQKAKKDAPTKLKNNKFAEQFQTITELFSTPKYGAIDPTALVAFMYPLFFGLMLADIGYGLLLLLAAIPLYQRLQPGKRWPVTVLTISASSAILFGAVFGSFFGELIPITPIYTDAFSATLPLLYASLAIGLLHLNLAVVLYVIQAVKMKESITETILTASPILLIQASAANYVYGNVLVGHILIAASAATLIKQKGFFGILDISGLVGNWFSYARILAISLATSGVALAVNTIAQQTQGLPAGGLLAAIILILGHTFNLAVSTIGAGINSARLHYVEFFNHFFATGGDTFTPFKRKNYMEVSTWSISLKD